MRGRSIFILIIVVAIAVYVARHVSVQRDSSAGPSSGTYSSIDPDLVIVNSTLSEQQAQAAGTGIVLTSTGEVITNSHVIEGATSIQVVDVGNGHSYTATVAGYDRSHDVAVLRLQGAQGLATAPLGTSDNPAVGQAVAAVGNVGGTGRLTVAAGTITALNQSVVASDQSSGSSEQLTGLIEVGANVQPGDSGGPTVDSSGRVIGITTAAGSSYSFRAATGAGFAIPIGDALPIRSQIDAGKASSTVHIGPTAQLGVLVGTAQAGTGGGAVVVAVVPGEPAQAAGIVPGDVIVTLDGAAVDGPTTLVALIDRDHPGQRVTLAWIDGAGQNHSAPITLNTGPAG
jgi:S1-C subfamily serine protease